MAENLKVTHYRNGDAIPNVIDLTELDNLTTGAIFNYFYNTKLTEEYGCFYNWYAVKDCRNIAPTGWHVPTDLEWQTLIDFLGGNSVAGGKLKEKGTLHWVKPNIRATNESGFSALPEGMASRYGGLGYCAFFWSSTELNSEYALSRELSNSSSGILGNTLGYKQYCYSVRCLKD